MPLERSLASIHASREVISCLVKRFDFDDYCFIGNKDTSHRPHRTPFSNIPVLTSIICHWEWFFFFLTFRIQLLYKLNEKSELHAVRVGRIEIKLKIAGKHHVGNELFLVYNCRRPYFLLNLVSGSHLKRLEQIFESYKIVENRIFENLIL